MKRIIYILFLIFLFFSCNNNLPEYYEIEIKSPKQNWIYYTDTEIVFSCNVKDRNLIWYSSIDGKIGEGYHFTRSLSEGSHTITLKDNKAKKTSSVCIEVQANQNYKNISLITHLPFNFNIDKNESFGIFSLNGKMDSSFLEFNSEKNNKNDTEFNRDIYLKNNLMNLQINKIKSARNIESGYQSREFYVINTNETLNSPHKIIAEKYYDGNEFSVWIPKGIANVNHDDIDKIIMPLENFVMRRVKELWGECADIDSNGKLTILFSKTINEENKAVGFFNSKDFFRNISEKTSSAYNPYSNEMDIIYVAFPDSENRNYSIESIIATVSHEFAHAVNFSQKTWKSLSKGDNDIVQEELFLDEGWSHLTELLCGYGSSGGDINFINFYLENSSYYSFCKNDYLGRNDSVGQRGAVCLFLYWLFEKAGGIGYENDGFDFIDQGGISFLKSMTDTKQTGWDCIGNYFNKNTDSLFIEFSKILLNQNINSFFNENKKDPVTNEYFLKNVSLKKLPCREYCKILPYSISNFGIFNNSGCITVNGTALNGNIYLYRY